MTKKDKPRLFGLNNSNRDFSKEDSWGKNKFNSSFPASLSCYLSHKDIKANYLSIKNGEFTCSEIEVSDAFNIDPLSKDANFNFESAYVPFQKHIFGALPRTDLVITNNNSECLSSFEIKLTALPDNTTCNLSENKFGSEIVVRPDTIVYLACSVAESIGDIIKENIKDNFGISDWSDADIVIEKIDLIIDKLRKIYILLEKKQTPFLLQPIWKTNGKSPQLAENCLDVFFWSDAGFIYLITEISDDDNRSKKITRQTRTAIWLYKMLLDISINGRFDHESIIDSLSYNTKNDKAFASSGNITNRFMQCERLIKPIIKKEEIKNIILGGGQNLLSPERRFDAIIFNSPELF